MSREGYDVFFDGIVGPTHNYGGLSEDNIAAQRNLGNVSNPKAAALQGLAKMKLLVDLGIKQAVLPPHERPHLPTLRALGFSGPDRSLPEKANKLYPEILPMISSAAAMYAANAASITPSVDTIDNKVHISPSNMARTPHRTLEPKFTAKILKVLFPSSVYFSHHPPLPFGNTFSDEGCANRCHFSATNSRTGIHLFAYGDSSRSPSDDLEGIKYRQSYEASEAIARAHKIPTERVILAEQSRPSLAAGVFHNDLVSTSCRHLFFVHELAFSDTSFVCFQIQDKLETLCNLTPHIIKVPNSVIPLKTAVNTYLFNSQLIELDQGIFSLVAPIECQAHPAVLEYLNELTKDPNQPIRDLHFANLRESMSNGGGPACLTLRASLTQNELDAVHQGVFLTERLYEQLVDWVNKYYRDRMEPKDILDPLLVDEIQAALEELTRLLDLGRIYDFQW